MDRIIPVFRIFGLILTLKDIYSDIILCFEYGLNGDKWWAGFTGFFIAFAHTSMCILLLWEERWR